MRILKENSSMGFTEGILSPSVHCKVYEDNIGALDMVMEYTYLPLKKFLDVKLHHFSYYVDREEITTHKIRTEDQPEDYLTKLMDEKIHVNHRKEFQRW